MPRTFIPAVGTVPYTVGNGALNDRKRWFTALIFTLPGRKIRHMYGRKRSYTGRLRAPFCWTWVVGFSDLFVFFSTIRYSLCLSSRPVFFFLPLVGLFLFLFSLFFLLSSSFFTRLIRFFFFFSSGHFCSSLTFFF